MGSVDVPDELCGELGEFDGLLEGELEVSKSDADRGQRRIEFYDSIAFFLPFCFCSVSLKITKPLNKRFNSQFRS